MILTPVTSKFCIGLLLFVIPCWCSEEKILGYGTQFGTLLEEGTRKVIGKQFTLFSLKTSAKKVDKVAAINIGVCI